MSLYASDDRSYHFLSPRSMKHQLSTGAEQIAKTLQNPDPRPSPTRSAPGSSGRIGAVWRLCGLLPGHKASAKSSEATQTARNPLISVSNHPQCCYRTPKSPRRSQGHPYYSRVKIFGILAIYQKMYLKTGHIYTLKKDETIW